MDMYQKKGDLIKQMRDVLDFAETEERELSAEESATYERMETELDSVEQSIARRQKLEAIETAASESATRTVMDEKVESFDPAADFRSFLRTGESRSTQVEGTPNLGGYLVPDDFYRTLVAKLQATNIMRGLATVVNTSSDTMYIPTEGTHGVAALFGENVEITETNDTFGQATLTPYKMGRLIKVSRELLADSAFDLSTYIANEVGRSIGVLEESYFVNGSGSSQPTGVIYSASSVVTASSPTAITADEIVDLYHGVSRQYRPNATWLAKDATIKLIRKLKTGVSSDNTYLWQAGLRDGEPDRLLGRPIFATENAPAATAGLKALAFGDMSYYYIVDRQGVTLQRLEERYAEYNAVGFLGVARSDGELINTDAVKVLTMASGS